MDFSAYSSVLHEQQRMDVASAVLYPPRLAWLGIWCFVAIQVQMADLKCLLQADFHAKYNGQKSECMEEAARIISKAFGNCLTDRLCPCPSPLHKLILNYTGHRNMRTRENGASTTSLALSSSAIFEQVFSFLASNHWLHGVFRLNGYLYLKTFFVPSKRTIFHH